MDKMVTNELFSSITELTGTQTSPKCKTDGRMFMKGMMDLRKAGKAKNIDGVRSALK